jgi:prepilin-type N-terminal cleavage/methylation domain-containing protein
VFVEEAASGPLLKRKVRMKGNESAFTLLEIMIVVTLIGVLAAVAIPSFTQSVARTQARACMANLKTIDMAKAEWMVAAQKQADEVPSDADLFGDGKPLRDKPTCPSGGTYDLRRASEKPVCSVRGHAF